MGRFILALRDAFFQVRYYVQCSFLWPQHTSYTTYMLCPLAFVLAEGAGVLLRGFSATGNDRLGKWKG